MAAIGSMEPFDPERRGDWPSYSARMDQYIAANAIEQDRQAATLITLIGSTTYKLLENLLAPDKPGSKNYKELTEALTKHLSPKPLLIAERYRFHKRDQESSETISQYVAALTAIQQRRLGSLQLRMLRAHLAE